MPVSIGKALVIAALLELCGAWALPSASVMRAQEPTRVKVAQEPARPAPTQLLDRIALFFRSTLVNIALVTIGLIGLIFEFKYPGTTLPGAVAAFCFVLFFWAHSFVGEFTVLAIMLFLLGLVLL